MLLIIAPDLFGCFKAAKAFGLEPPHIENFRNITRASELRGTDPGTPFITLDRENWDKTQAGYDLDVAVTCHVRTGRLRIAQPDDIAAHRTYGDLPDRPEPARMAADAHAQRPVSVEGRL